MAFVSHKWPWQALGSQGEGEQDIFQEGGAGSQSNGEDSSQDLASSGPTLDSNFPFLLVANTPPFTGQKHVRNMDLLCLHNPPDGDTERTVSSVWAKSLGLGPRQASDQHGWVWDAGTGSVESGDGHLDRPSHQLRISGSPSNKVTPILAVPYMGKGAQGCASKPNYA